MFYTITYSNGVIEWYRCDDDFCIVLFPNDTVRIIRHTSVNIYHYTKMADPWVIEMYEVIDILRAEL